MKTLVCEMCGSNNLVKKDGVFVCQYCGTQYSVEEAKKMMIEGTVEIKGTVSIDRSNEYGKYMIVAKENIENGTWESGYNACEKALEIEPQSSEAWQLKAKYLIRHGNKPTSYIISAINSATKYAQGDKNELAFELMKELFTASSNKQELHFSICTECIMEINDLSVDARIGAYAYLKNWYEDTYKNKINSLYGSMDKYIGTKCLPKNYKNEVWYLINELAKYINEFAEREGSETRFPVREFAGIITYNMVGSKEKFSLGEESLMSYFQDSALKQYRYSDIRKVWCKKSDEAYFLNVETNNGEKAIFCVMYKKIAPEYSLDDFLRMIDILVRKVKENGGEASAEAQEIQKKCYVATCVYGSYDCPQVWTLRRYRDDTLGATWYGRLFIRTYYAISPTLVKWFGNTNWFKKLWKGKLDRMVKRLQDNGVEDTPYEDKNW